MRCRASIAVLAITLISAVVVAPHDAAAQEEAPEFELLHFWISPGERQALDIIAEALREKGYAWADSGITNYQVMKRDAIQRIIIGAPPSAMLWLGGEDVTNVARLDVLEPLDDLAEDLRWNDVLHEAARFASTVDGKVVVAPITIHNENWSWYNASIYRELGLGLPADWEEFIDQGAEIEAAGYYPLATGADDWVIRILFSSVLAGAGGPETYNRFYAASDPSVIDDPRMRHVLGLMARLRHLAAPVTAARTWSDATYLVLEGRAAMVVMGDWARAEFNSAGKRVGEDYYCEPTPGGGAVSVAAIDTFAFPKAKSEAQREVMAQFVRTLVEPDIQVRFANAKGSTPIRQDIDVAALNECARKALPNLSDHERTLYSPRLIMPERKRTIFQKYIAEFWRDKSIPLETLEKQFRDVLAAD